MIITHFFDTPCSEESRFRSSPLQYAALRLDSNQNCHKLKEVFLLSWSQIWHSPSKFGEIVTVEGKQLWKIKESLSEVFYLWRVNSTMTKHWDCLGKDTSERVARSWDDTSWHVVSELLSTKTTLVWEIQQKNKWHLRIRKCFLRWATKIMFS